MMNGRRILSVVVSSVCILALAGGLALARETVARPNIVLCMADDQGWGDVAYAGHPALETPKRSRRPLVSAGLREV